MININEILLVGQTGKDSKLTEYTPKGKPAFKALRFSVATNNVWYDAQGQKHENADWTNVVQNFNQDRNGNYPPACEMLWNALTRGARVLVQGRLTQRQYKQDGIDMNFTEVQTNAVGGKIVLLDKNDQPMEMNSSNVAPTSGTEIPRTNSQPQYREQQPVVDISDMEVIPH